MVTWSEERDGWTVPGEPGARQRWIRSAHRVSGLCEFEAAGVTRWRPYRPASVEEDLPTLAALHDLQTVRRLRRAFEPDGFDDILAGVATAQRLGSCRSLLYELLAADEIESITIGRLRRIPVDALATYIERQRAGDQDRRRT